MLMQNFKSAADLNITEPQKDALIKTLVLMETGKLKHVPYQEIDSRDKDGGRNFTGHFNMIRSYIAADCGTISCIKGTAEMVGDVHFAYPRDHGGLHSLFYDWFGDDPNTDQAARALRSYLTTGDPKWAEAGA